MDSQLPAALSYLVHQFLHSAGVLTGMDRGLGRSGQVGVALHGNGLVGVVSTEVLVHLLHSQRASALGVAKELYYVWMAYELLMNRDLLHHILPDIPIVEDFQSEVCGGERG